MPIRKKSINVDGPLTEKERARISALNTAIETSGSSIVDTKFLILIDLQGMYLALHHWLSSRCEIGKNGFLLSRFAHLQIQRSVVEISRRLAARAGNPSEYIGDLYERIKVEKKEGKYILADEIKVLKDGVYLSPETNIEIFYAPAPLREISWQLRKQAKNGSYRNRIASEKADAGIIERDGLFQRDYSAYGNFVEELQNLSEHKRSHEGFFSFYVNEKGLKYFDEKEVDTRIVMRAMEAIILGEVDAVCVVSSDQDFVPLAKKAADGGVDYFQADLAKFLTTDRVGRRFEQLGDGFIASGIDPVWPLEILTEAMTVDAIDHHSKYGLDDAEVDLLIGLHNEMNEVQLELIRGEGEKVQLAMRRPA